MCGVWDKSIMWCMVMCYVAYGYVLCGVWDKCAMWRMVMWRMVMWRMECGACVMEGHFSVAYGYVAFGTVHTLQKQFPSLLNFVACS